MGVDLTNFFTPHPMVTRSSTKLLFVGRLVEKKGINVLISAMPKILKQYPEVSLTVAGAGPLEKQVKMMVKKNNLLDKVCFLGMLSQSKLPSLYRRAAVTIFPFIEADSGDQEGLGLVVVEAIGCMCPVVASDIPAIHDTIIHEKNGFLVHSCDPEALSEAIINLLSKPSFRRRLAQEAREKIIYKFDWNVVSEKYNDLYIRQIRNDW